MDVKDFALQEVLGCPFVKCFGVSGSGNKTKKTSLFFINEQFTANVEEFHVVLGLCT